MTVCLAEFEIRLQECFEESKNNFSIEQVKSTMLSVYDVPMSFQLKSPLQSLFLLFFKYFVISMGCCSGVPIEFFNNTLPI